MTSYRAWLIVFVTLCNARSYYGRPIKFHAIINNKLQYIDARADR